MHTHLSGGNITTINTHLEVTKCRERNIKSVHHSLPIVQIVHLNTGKCVCLPATHILIILTITHANTRTHTHTHFDILVSVNHFSVHTEQRASKTPKNSCK